MSLILIVSILLRIIAMVWSFTLLVRIKDWRMGFLTLMLGLMATRQTLTLFKRKVSLVPKLSANLDELPGLFVSILAFLFVHFFVKLIGNYREAQNKLETKYREVEGRLIYFLHSSKYF